MMHVDFPEANIPVGKPAGWKDEDCSEVRAWHGPTPLPSGKTGHSFILKLMPSKEDINNMVNGGPLWVQFFSDRLVPHSVYTEYPFVIPADPAPAEFPEGWGIPKEIVDMANEFAGASSMTWFEQPKGNYDTGRATDLVLDFLSKLNDKYVITPKLAPAEK